MKVAVIGIGQSMRSDDAIGLEAVQNWQRNYRQTASHPEVIVEITELPGLDLLERLNTVNAAVLVDAVRSNSPVATIHRLDLNQLSAFSTTGQSAHGWGLAETLTLARKMNFPAGNIDIRIIGVEVGQVELGRGLSKEIEGAMSTICAAIEATLQALLD